MLDFYKNQYSSHPHGQLLYFAGAEGKKNMENVDLLQSHKDHLLAATLASYPADEIADPDQSWRWDFTAKIVAGLDLCFFQEELGDTCWRNAYRHAYTVVSDYPMPDKIKVDGKYKNFLYLEIWKDNPALRNETNLRMDFYRFTVMDTLAGIANAIDDIFPPTENDQMSPGEALRWVADDIAKGRLLGHVYIKNNL